MNKLAIFFLVVCGAFQASAITTKNCPETLKLDLKSFEQGQPPAPSRDNPELPYAYIELERMQTLSGDLKLVSTYDSQCHYSSQKKASVRRAVIEGSLRANTKNPAVLKVYFSRDVHYGAEVARYSYVVYAPLKNLTKDKALFLKGASSVYYAGEQCSWGECIPDYFRIGEAFVSVKHEEGVSCISKESAQKVLADHIKVNRSSAGSDEYDQDDYYDDNWDREENIERYDFSKPEQVMKYVETLNFSNGSYMAGVTWSYQCAASVECWGGFGVRCDGEVFSWSDGED